MSVPPIEVRATYDGSELTTGMSEAEASVETLAREVETAADSINTSLRSVDDGVSSSLGSGGSLDTGTQQAESSLQSFADNAKEEVPGAMLDLQDGVTGAASGIAAALAPMGAGGTVIAGVIAGFVVMKNQADAAAQAMRDKVNAAFSAIEVKARTTNEAIVRLYEQQQSFTATLEEFGEGDATKGYQKLTEWADTLGVETEQVVAVIQNKQTPAADRLRVIMEHHVDLMKEGTGVLTAQQQVTANIATAASHEAEARKLTLQMSKDNRDILRDNKETTEDTREDAERIADANERSADALRRGADDAGRLADNLSRAGRNANIHVDLGV